MPKCFDLLRKRKVFVVDGGGVGEECITFGEIHLILATSLFTPLLGHISYA